MHSILHTAHAGRNAPVQVVLLPAAYTGPEDFVRAGFAAAVRERQQLNIDVTFAALEFQHVTDRSVVARVREELIAPALERGRVLWLGGISLGGYVALCCAAREPAGLAGLCLFAPYLGSHIITREIARNGLRGWPTAAADEADEADEERRLWRFIKTRAPHAPQIHLGLGSEDRFGARHQLLAAALEPKDVDTVTGGHDWPTWRRLWENFLDARLTPGS